MATSGPSKLEQIYTQLRKVLRKYYWSRIDSDSDMTPVKEAVKYVEKACSEGLNKRDECRYAALKLLFSVLDMTNRRTVDSVEEMNDIYRAGLDLATQVWEMYEKVLDSVQKSLRGE
ncbi:MAG: hypothetical protein ACE5R6_10525 [Candidatus Heimdallarchaeota archaeon]